MVTRPPPTSETHPWTTFGLQLLALGSVVPVASKLVDKFFPGWLGSIPQSGKIALGVLLAAILVLPLILLVSRFRQIIREGKARQHDRDAAAHRIAATLASPLASVEPYAFYVRPFFSDDRFAWETTDIGSDDVVRYGFRVAIEDMLARAIEPRLPLIALSGKGIGFGPGEINSTDAEWEDKALLLMEQAQIIFALPFTQPSTLSELEVILSSEYIEKTIFVVPPLYRPPVTSGPIRESFLGRKAEPLEIYRESHKILSRIAPDMPVFAKPGGVFWHEPGRWRSHPFKRREDWTEACLRDVFSLNDRLLPFLD